MIKAVLLDIEGTTTPIDFVHKVLFPYAKLRIGEFVRDHWATIETELQLLADEYSRDDAYPNQLDISSATSVSEYLKFLIDTDRKSTPLKWLQGKLWQEGYESGELRSVTYDDVPLALAQWHSRGLNVSTYSSGSVLAQRLIFLYSNHGDLSAFISNYFDTNIGHKRDALSYNLIAERLDVSTDEILFVSDIIAELDAAASVNFRTALSDRPGNSVIDGDISHQIITGFDQLIV